ncbi:Hsp20 family protein [Bacillus mangrovi]|uniref:Hsp20 family protein n=1 Tax=Metabacillus mangrovi TaxID=1491830 RepID=A0A7X2V4W1_9BACI|nr:Hsp20/alpha crystallin family protein [Metabacillus mangrovi]MTH53820.1 Hsp20 family protein [Metabacillus mangrovi]
MDKEKIQKWLSLSDKYQKSEFWKMVFDHDPDLSSAAPVRSHENPFPRYDLYVHEETLVVSIEIPGYRKEDFNITLDSSKTKLLFKGAQHPPYSYQYRVYTERAFGDTERTITLPFPVEKETVHSRYAFGILELTFKKAPEEADISIGFDNGHTDGP